MGQMEREDANGAKAQPTPLDYSLSEMKFIRATQQRQQPLDQRQTKSVDLPNRRRRTALQNGRPSTKTKKSPSRLIILQLPSKVMPTIGIGPTSQRETYIDQHEFSQASNIYLTGEGVRGNRDRQTDRLRSSSS